jgi:hypothetical protein
MTFETQALTSVFVPGDRGSLATDRSLGPLAHHHSTKDVHTNTNGGGYIWVYPEQLEQAAAKRTLPPQLAYAGVLLGLLLCLVRSPLLS